MTVGANAFPSTLARFLREQALPWVRQYGVSRLLFCRPPFDPAFLPEGTSIIEKREPHSPPAVKRRSWEIARLWRDEHLCAFRFPHLACVLKGTAELQVGATVLRVPQGTFLLIPPYIPIDDDRPHWRSAPPTEPIDLLWLLITPSVVRAHICFSDKGRHSYTPLQFTIAPTAYSLTLTLMEELTRQEEGFQEVATGYLLAILWQVLRGIEAATFPVPLSLRMETALEEDRIAHAQNIALQNFPRSVPVQNLSDLLGVSPSRLRHRFKEATGKSPQAYVRTLRLKAAQQLLKRTKLPIAVIAQLLGFQDPFYFSRWLRRNTGKPPSALRRCLPAGKVP